MEVLTVPKTLGAKSLVRLATDACVHNLRLITDVGELPYSVVRPFLMRLENPEQLIAIEEASPQIRGADAEVWQNIMRLHIRGWNKKRCEPRNPQSWYKVYRKLKREMDEEDIAQAEALKARLGQHIADKQSHQMTYIDKVIIPKKKANQATVFSRTGNPAVLSFGSGSRTRTDTGRGLLVKAKREARERGVFSTQRNPLATPTHLLSESAILSRKAVPRQIVPAYETAPAPQLSSTRIPKSSAWNAASEPSRTTTPKPFSTSVFSIARPSDKSSAANTVERSPGSDSGRQSPAHAALEPRPPGSMVRKRPPVSVLVPSKRRKL